MRRILILIALLIVAVVIQMLTTMPSAAIAQSEQETRKARIIELQELWKQKEDAQGAYHREAEQQRKALCNLGEMDFCKFVGDPVSVSITPYNPEVAQTDSSPCYGASGKNLCELSKTERIAALSQDLVGRAEWKKFRYGDLVYMKGRVAGCTGVFRVEDTMNARFTNYGDVFLMDRKDNFGTCVSATVQKLRYNID